SEPPDADGPHRGRIEPPIDLAGAALVEPAEHGAHERVFVAEAAIDARRREARLLRDARERRAFGAVLRQHRLGRVEHPTQRFAAAGLARRALGEASGHALILSLTGRT